MTMRFVKRLFLQAVFLIVSPSHFLFLYFLPQLKRIIEELAKEI